MTAVITNGRKYADFVFYEDGTFTVEAIRFTGKECKDFTEPFERALAPLRRVEYAVAGPLKIPTSRARMRRPIAPRNAPPPRAVLIAVPDPDRRRWQRAFEILLEAGRVRLPETNRLE